MNVTVSLSLEEVKPLIGEVLRNRLALDQYNDSLNVNIEVPKEDQYFDLSLASNRDIRAANKIFLIKMIREAQTSHTKAPNGELCMGLTQAKGFVEAYLNL